MFVLCFFFIFRYKKFLVFVVWFYLECLQMDDICFIFKMEELLNYMNIMEKVFQENEIFYIVIDVLDLMKRVDIVKEKIFEYKSFKVVRID